MSRHGLPPSLGGAGWAVLVGRGWRQRLLWLAATAGARAARGMPVIAYWPFVLKAGKIAIKAHERG